MATTWIVAADASRARILQVMDREQRLSEIEDLYNPAGRLNEREMTSDAEPRFHGSAGPGSDREAKGAVEHEVEMFAKRLGDYLDKARTSHRYDRLHLIAPPKFLGQLRKELDKEVGKLVAEELPKDLSWLDARELERKYFGRG
ncbi:MAG TPA: host attachment protein [Burkholderiales bacterium]|jgi:protein required for attachment to host cells|nr:host attachment protein [Burkholderiales bacterium]